MAGLFGSAAATSSSNQSQGDLSKDVPLKDLPEDSVSDIKFSSKTDHLAVSSWDKKVRIYEISPQGDSQGKAMMEFEGPVLSCAWSEDGTKVVGGGADKAARMLDLNSPTTPQQVAVHDQPIRCVRMIEASGNPMLVTGSWDKKVKYWDLRQQNPVASIDCQERIYCMDVRDKLLVIGTADRYINMVNLATNPGAFYKTMQSPLKWQTRTVACFTDASGFAIGSVEGRCAIQYVEDKDKDYNFSFKCHRNPNPTNRNQTDVYSVNSISFHPVHGTFCTAGADGTFNFWDKDAKHRLKGFPETGQSITATSFSKSGGIFAYACSYDWSKGYASHTPQSVNKIMLHPVADEEVKPKGGGRKK